MNKKSLYNFFYVGFIKTISFMIVSSPFIVFFELFVFDYTIKTSLLQKFFSFLLSVIGFIRLYTNVREYLIQKLNLEDKKHRHIVVFDAIYGIIYHYLCMFTIYTLTLDFDYEKHFYLITTLAFFIIMGYPIIGFSTDLFLNFFNIKKSRRIEKRFNRDLQKFLIILLIVVSLISMFIQYYIKI